MRTILVSSAPDDPGLVRDPKDVVFLATAIAANADFLITGDRDLLTVETSRGAEQTLSTAKYEVTGRGGKGRELLQRGQFTRVLWPTPDAPAPLTS